MKTEFALDMAIEQSMDASDPPKFQTDREVEELIHTIDELDAIDAKRRFKQLVVDAHLELDAYRRGEANEIHSRHFLEAIVARIVSNRDAGQFRPSP